MVQVSELQPTKYKGSTIEQVLQAICDANTQLTLTSTSLLERLNKALESMLKSNIEQQALMKRDALFTALFGIAEGAATIGGSAVSLVTPNDAPIDETATIFNRTMDYLRKPEALRMIESGSKATASLCDKGARVSSSLIQGAKTGVDFRHNLENRMLNNAQETNSTVERERDSLINSATAILNAKSRSSQ